ncbi:MAG TPA: TIGR02270 family protein [Chitinispirillaceae bacterium]|nr:TIGR02270 family protein [Chitinispirillaceae bacterium]
MTTTAYPHILLQFLDESSFLWERYNAALFAPHYNSEKLADLKERLEAQLGGLHSCDQDGWEAVLERICDNPVTGEIFTASVLAINSAETNRIDTVQNAITKPGHALELASALTWFSFERTKTFCDNFLESSSPLLQLAGLTAYAAIRENPGKYLDTALSSPDPHLRGCALKMIGESGLAEKIPVAKTHFSDKDPTCAFRAAWSASLLGDTSAIQVLLQFLDKKFPFADEAAMVAIRKSGSNSGPSIIHELTKSPDTIRWAIIGAGALGAISNIPWLIDMMKQTTHSRIAGEAFSTITGLDIVRLHMDTDAPVDFEEAPNDNPDDERVDLDADYFLPWPDVNKVNAWWNEHAADFSPNTRYICGKQIDKESLNDILANGYQRQRYSVAIELMALHQSETILKVF